MRVFKIYVGASTPVALFTDIPSFTDRQQLVSPNEYVELIGQWEGIDVVWAEDKPPARDVQFLYGYLFGCLTGYTQAAQEPVLGLPDVPLPFPDAGPQGSINPLSDGLSRTVEGP